MTARASWSRLLRAAVAAGLAVTACGSGASPPPPLPVGPGVTATTLTLGVLTDLTGPFSQLGEAVTQGSQLFWEDQNRRGGVCGRTVELTVKDHGGSLQTATTVYAALKDRVLALQQLLGAEEIDGLRPGIDADAMPTLPVSWSSKLLADRHLALAGTTYDLEMIDAVDWLMRTRGLKAGDRLGHIYLAGSYGEDALLGTTAAATANHLTLVTQRVLPTDRDLTAQVQALKATGARFIMMTTTASQAASAASVAQAESYDATFVGSSPTFMPSLLEGPARTAMERQFFVVQSYSPFAGDTAAATMVRDEYRSAYAEEAPSLVNSGADFGYGQGEVMYRVLDAACRAGSLRRAALLTALRSLRDVDTGGVLAPLDYSTPGQPPARAAYILQPESTVQGGLRVVEPLTVAPLAKTYHCPC